MRKNETVIGIMGNTHGVNSDAKPKVNAVNKNGRRSCCAVAGRVDELGAEAVVLTGSATATAGINKYPPGILNPLAAEPLANAKPEFTDFFTGGKHFTSLQA